MSQNLKDRALQRDNTNTVVLLCKDISEPKHLEQALYENATQIHLLKDAGSSKIAYVNAQQRYRFIDKRYEEWYTTFPEKILGKHVQELMSASDYQKVQGYIETVLSGEKVTHEFTQTFKDGKKRYLVVDYVPHINETGEVLGFFIVCQDLTEHKQAEELLRQQAEREQALNRVTQAIRSSLDLETIFATAVEEIGKLLQVDRAGIVQYLPERKLWLNVANYRQCSVPIALSVEFPDEGNEIAARLKRLEILRIDDTSTFEDKSNRNHVQFPGAWLLVPLHFRSSLWGCLCLMLENRPHHWQNSEVELACAVADQLMMAIQQSEYQQVQRLNADLERQVQERTAQLQQALNFEAMLKRITDKVRDSLEESQILQTVGQELAQGLRVNRCDTALYNADQTNACICYEYTTSSPPSFQGCVVQMAEFPEVFYQLLQGQCFQFCEIGSNPIWRHGTTLVCPIFDAQGVLGDLWLLKHKDEAFNELEIRLVQQVANQCAIAIRQARITREVQAQVEELAKLNRLKDDFLSTVSHELRTPMVNIKMAIFMLTVAFNQDSSLTQQSRVHRYLQILEDESAREINLINDLLDLQQLETGKQTLALEKIHLQSWLLKEIEPFKERFRNRQQTLRLDIPPTLPHLVSDPSSLSRILAELLNNACKYTPPGEQITVTAEAILGRILLKVLNSGTEIPNCELPHIFNKFYRIPSTDPWKQSGTGLGLALVQKLIENLGVTIKVESASNQTCFTLELPLTVSNTGGGAPA